ncbi:MAG: beta-lactamase family protein [Polaromonas sp.]|nr:beta-lactamase family protein [Polaromonas sp.]
MHIKPFQFSPRKLAYVSAAWMLSAVAQAQPLPMATPESVGMSSQRLEKITSTFKQEVAQGKLPGAVVMIARKGKLVYSQAFGKLNNASGGDMKLDSIFRIYSMTKPMASTALMMLVEDGQVQLTDPVSKYLPSFKSPMVSVPVVDPATQATTFKLVAANKEPTVQDLLRHTSGIAYGELTKNTLVRDAYIKAGVYKTDLDYDARELPGAQMAEALGKAPLAQQPGTTWEYSLSVDVQGRVVEAVTGKRLGEFMDERIFKPLKMKDTGFSVPAENASRLAEAFPKDPATGLTNKLIDVSKPPGNDSGGAGGVSTAGDYLRFCQAMLNGGQLDGARILSRPTVTLMTSDHLGSTINTSTNPGMLLLGSQGYTFGLGFLVRQGDGIAGVHGSAGEFMWAGAAGTFFWADPKEQTCTVYMSQSPSPQRAYYRRLLKSGVSQALGD